MERKKEKKRGGWPDATSDVMRKEMGRKLG